MKQLELMGLLRDAFGDLRSGLFISGREAHTRAGNIIVQLESILALLQKVKPMPNGITTTWPGIWLQVQRESWQEIKSLYPEESNEELKDLVAVEAPHKVTWYRVDFSVDGNLLILRLYPAEAQMIADMKKRTVMLPRGYETREQLKYLSTFTRWLAEDVKAKLLSFLANPRRYNSKLESSLPRYERFGRLRRKDFWKFALKANHRIKNELTTGERKQFCKIAFKLYNASPIKDLTVNDFLRFCEICYEGAGYQLAGLNPLGKYKAMADGRHDGLLEIDPDSKAALAKWFRSNPKGGHPWEIARGGNMTHISLYLHFKDGEYRLSLEGSAITRASETIRMAIALHQEEVPFELLDTDLHVRRVQGSDWIGVVPDYYLGALHFGALFPSQDQVHDVMSHESLNDHPGLLRHVFWYPVPPLLGTLGKH